MKKLLLSLFVVMFSLISYAEKGKDGGNENKIDPSIEADGPREFAGKDGGNNTGPLKA